MKASSDIPYIDVFIFAEAYLRHGQQLHDIFRTETIQHKYNKRRNSTQGISESRTNKCASVPYWRKFLSMLSPFHTETAGPGGQLDTRDGHGHGDIGL